MSPRILIVADNASARFGGEAFIPLHYFRIYRKRGLPVFLLTHARVREELLETFPEDHDRLFFIDDTIAQRALWNTAKRLSSNLTGFALNGMISLLNHEQQHSQAKALVRGLRIDVVHQPTPVSPRFPSALFDLGAPVVVGPMNGNISVPDAFRDALRVGGKAATSGMRRISEWLHYPLGGKRKAAMLLVANERTRVGLPPALRGVTTFILSENGVDLERFAASRGDHAAVPPRFLFMGRLVAWKGPSLLIESFSRMQDQGATLEFLGDGPERPRLQSMVEERGLANRVTFHGFVAQHKAAELLSNARALVFPSFGDCGGAVVLEAMANRVPVIAAEWGGPADYLDPSCGILIKPESPEQFVADLAAAMDRLSSDSTLCERLGAAGQEKVRRLYDWERKADVMLFLYQQVLGTMRGSGYDTSAAVEEPPEDLFRAVRAAGLTAS